MALTTEETAELTAMRAALVRASSGTAIRGVQSGNRRMDYAAPDLDAIQRRIDALEAKACGKRRRGAVSFRV